VLAAGAVVAAGLLGGVVAAGAASAAFLLNVAYSRRLEGVPLLDVACVGAIGAAFLGVVAAPLPACLVVGLMTGMSHVFQTLVDRPVDLAGACRTSAVWSARAAAGLLATGGIALGAVVAPTLGAGAVSALAPLAVHEIVGEPRRAWLLSKLCLAALWVALLGADRLAG
jgi:hypothetical protein